MCQIAACSALGVSLLCGCDLLSGERRQKPTDVPNAGHEQHDAPAVQPKSPESDAQKPADDEHTIVAGESVVVSETELHDPQQSPPAEIDPEDKPTDAAPNPPPASNETNAAPASVDEPPAPSLPVDPPAANNSSAPPAAPADPPPPSAPVPPPSDPPAPPQPTPPGEAPAADPPTPLPAMLALDATVLDFGDALGTQSFQIQNAGGGELSYTVYNECGWVTLNREVGTSTGEADEIVATVDRTWLIDWTIEYVCEIFVESSTGETRVLTARTRVPPPTVNLTTPTTLADFGEDLHEVVVELHNPGGDAVAYSVLSSTEWLTPTRTSGTLPTGDGVERVALILSRCSLSIGEHLAEVRIRPTVGEDLVIPARAVVPAPLSDAELADLLAPLPALPKVHPSYSTPARLLDEQGSGLLFEWARLTHVVTIPMPGGSEQRLVNAVSVCSAVNALNPAIPCRIAFKYSPYHYQFPDGRPPMYDGPEVQQELDTFATRLAQHRDWLSAANVALGADVQLYGIVLNTEQWRAKRPDQPGAAVWNAAATAKYDAVFDICDAVCPGAPVHWYNRGKPIDRGGFFTLAEQGDSCSIELYMPHDLVGLRQRYALASAFAATIVQTPAAWINLNGAFTSDFEDGRPRYVCGFRYPIGNAWQLGFELNSPDYVPSPDDPAPLADAPEVVIYPGPFATTQPDFAAYFVAYVKGAANIPLGE